MKLASMFLIVLVVGAGVASAQEHILTRLDDPAIRFSNALTSPDDLRLLLKGPQGSEVAAILMEAGWRGHPYRLFLAAESAEIHETLVQPGTRLRFMATRDKGKPKLLWDVLWAGSEPIRAYAFEFSFDCGRYLFVFPKASGNFWIWALGLDPKCAGSTGLPRDPGLPLDPPPTPPGTTTRTVIEGDRARSTRGHAKAASEWTVLIRDHHPAYITWEQYERGQRILAENANMKGRMITGAPREGSALLAGLLRCGRCGRKFQVHYSGKLGTALYRCRGANYRQAAPRA